MKTCPNCGAQIADDALFCTECGNQIPQGNACSHCGATVNSDSLFCENCGRNMSDGNSTTNTNFQPQTPYATGSGSQNKLILPIAIVGLIGLLVLALAGGGWWYYKSSNSLQKGSGTIVTTNSVVSVDNNSKKYIMNYLNNILPKAIKMPEQQAIEKYFTKEFADLYRKVEICDSIVNANGNIGFWDFDFWTGGQDGDLTSIKVLDISDLSQNQATALVQYVIKFGDYDESKSSCSLYLVLENEKWRIDDFNNYKDRFKDYLGSADPSNNDSNPYIGKTYEGSGKGGGIYTEITITFLDNNNCRCISDWYQAYPEGKTLNGTYEVENGHIFVHCAYDGINYDFDFDVSDDGHSIGFDKSDPEESGTIGIDIMGLELVE